MSQEWLCSYYKTHFFETEYQKLPYGIAKNEQKEDEPVSLPEYRSSRFFYRHRSTPPWPHRAGAAHTHNQCELIYFVRGDAEHIVEDRKYLLAKGDLVIVRPQTYHDIFFLSEREYERYNILFDIEALGLSLAAEVCERFEVVSLAASPMTAAIFPKLETYRSRLSPEEFEAAATHLLFELFYDLSLLTPEGERPYSTLHPTLSRALAYIRDNLFTVRDVGEVAAQLHVTESYLFRLFRAELKTTPKRYITDKRLVTAQSLIRLGRRPSEVCFACGFGDYTAFWRAYKRMFGISPSEE